MDSKITHTLALALLFIMVSKARIIKIEEISGGRSTVKPRTLHVRNNLKGTITIQEDATWSLVVTVKAKTFEAENSVKVQCKTQSNDNILDIQLFRSPAVSTSALSTVDFTTKPDDVITAEVLLKVPQFTIMPGSRVFHADKKSVLKLKGASVRYKNVIKEFDIQAVTEMIDITLPCYSKCPKACDVGSGTCVPCERGYTFNHKASNMDSDRCSDVDECKTGTFTCPPRTICNNTIGSYECKCGNGFYGNLTSCKACKTCPTGFYQLSSCNSSHNTVCKACSPPCNGNLYEVHQCGIAYDRYCEDITANLKKIGASKQMKPKGAKKGARLFASKEYKKYIITDDRMELAKTLLNISSNQDTASSVLRSKRFELQLKLTDLNVLPIFADFDARKQNENHIFSKISGFGTIRNQFCRFPAPDYFILSHNILKNHEGLVKTRTCKKMDLNSCPGDTRATETFAIRTNSRCDGTKCLDKSCLDGNTNSTLYCDGYVGLGSQFAFTSFTDGSPWKFYTEDCLALYLSCKECKEKCNDYQNPKQCLKYCRKLCLWYRKHKCNKIPLRCAKGDFSQFGLSARFTSHDLRARFNCYLNHKLPKKLFNVRYRFVVKDLQFEGRWRDIEPVIKKSREDFVDYETFQVKYHLGGQLTKNVLLTGYEFGNFGLPGLFEIRPLQKSRKSELRLVNKKLRFQLLNPFEVTTGNFRDIRNCRKLSKWSELLSMGIYSNVSNAGVWSVDKIKTQNADKLYRVNSKASSAAIEISIPQTTSILREFASSAELVTFNATVKSNSTHWSLHLRGNVSLCPAVLGIEIIEATQLFQLLHQDAFIQCPITDFHFYATIRKIRPIHKERLFVIYVNDGKHSYEARVEKRRELKIAYNLKKKPKLKVDVTKNLWVKLFPLITLTGTFIVGLLSLMVFARLSRPDKKSSKSEGYELAAVKLGDYAAVEEKIEKEGRMRKRFLIPIVFLVTARVAYSFLMTASVITMIFYAINKENLDILKDAKKFIDTKVNESKRINLALEQFRESEIKFMTDRAAFLECACDYHMGRILRNIRDNMTAIVQLHDVLAFDQISEALIRSIQREVMSMPSSESKIAVLRRQVHDGIKKIESQLEHYGSRVRNNKWFKAARFLYRGWKVYQNMNFLDALGAFNLGLFTRLKKKILGQFAELKKKLSLAGLIRRLKKPLYPITNFLMSPVRYMKAKVKKAMKDYIIKLKNKILRNIPCFGNVDTKKWEKHGDDLNEIKNNQCQLAKAKKFVEKIAEIKKSIKNGSDPFSIKSAHDNSVYNVLDGDKAEEDYERRQASRLAKLKKVGQFYKPQHTAKAAFKYISKYSVVLVLIFDVLLIIFRNIKTYKFAFMMAAGYEVLKHHKKSTDESGKSADSKNRSFARKVIDRFAKSAGGMYQVFQKAMKILFTSLIIPVLIILACVVALFYLMIAFTYNAMNIQTLDQLGAFKLFSARLDLTNNVTKSAVDEHANYLNRFDLGAYKETVKAQTQEFRSSMDEFHAAEVIRMKRMKGEICDIENKKGCNIKFDKLMEKLDIKMKPCVMPVIKARKPNDIYNSKAYRMRLKHEMKAYVDAFRGLILNTFYLVIGIIGTIVLIIVCSKTIFKFLAAQDMIRFRNKHVYEEIPGDLKQEYHVKVSK